MLDYSDYLDDHYDNSPRIRRTRPRIRTTPTEENVVSTLTAVGEDTEGQFRPSFTGSRHEHQWIMTYLSVFYENRLITDVLRQVKGGKEATVYCCKGHPATGMNLLAAKVYRPRMFRNLRNDSQYRQNREVLNRHGKAVRDRRTMLAVEKGTRYGQEVAHTSWLAHEYETLEALYERGLDVPQPLVLRDNAMLMEYLGEEVRPAPTLNHVHLEQPEARRLFERLLWNVEVMLEARKIHGDLSAYNVLYWQGDIRIIDFPQAVDPFLNPDARLLFDRDVTRLCSYFERHGVDLNPTDIAAGIWNRAMPVEDMELQRIIDEFALQQEQKAREEEEDM